MPEPAMKWLPTQRASGDEECVTFDLGHLEVCRAEDAVPLGEVDREVPLEFDQAVDSFMS
jgi:hypothetical protein